MRDALNGKVVGDTSTEAAFYFVSKTSFSGLIRRNGRGEYNVNIRGWVSLSNVYLIVGHLL